MTYRSELDHLRHRLTLVEAERDALAAELALFRDEVDRASGMRRLVERLEARVAELSSLPERLAERDARIRALELDRASLEASLPRRIESSAVQARRLAARNRELSETLAQERALRAPARDRTPLERTLLAAVSVAAAVAWAAWFVLH